MDANGTAEVAPTGADADDDKEFDPPIEMMIHDYDDERTLDDEEALDEEEDVLDELSDLHKDNEIPLAELFAMHGYGEVHGATGTAEDDIEAVMEDDEDCCVSTVTFEATETRITSSQVLQMYVDDGDEDIYTALDFSNSGMYKTTRVGDEYQAQVPDAAATSVPYDVAPDLLLWDPNHLAENQVEAFNKATEARQGGVESWVRDNDEYLYSLMQCNFNVEEALRRHSFSTIQPLKTPALWTEQEVDKFENGLCTYGKDFFKIHQNKLPSKSVMDIIKFYYLHKKTPRHNKLVTRADVKISRKTQQRSFKISSNRNLQFLENLLGNNTTSKAMAAEA